MRITVNEADRQPHKIEQGSGTIAAVLPSLQTATNLQRTRQRHSQSQPGIGQGLRILKNHLNPRAQRSKLGLAETADLGAVELDATGCRLQQPHQQSPQRGLAGAELADQTKHGAARHREVDPFDNLAHRRLLEY